MPLSACVNRYIGHGSGTPGHTIIVRRRGLPLFASTIAAMSGNSQPNLDEIEERLAAVVAGRMSRDAADRWARRWVTDDELEWDDLEWWALNLLFGIDLPAGSGQNYLHDNEQVRKSLQELRRRRATRS